MPEAMICVSESQIMVVIPSVLAPMPWPDHTEIEDMPKPTPKIISTSDNAAAATVPASTAPQLTAECEVSASIEEVP